MGPCKATEQYTNGKVQVESVDFESTGAWESWDSSVVTLKLPAGASTITIASLTKDGGPNIDRIEFVNKNAVIPVNPGDSVVGDSGTTVLQRIPVRSNTLRNGGRNFLVNGRSAGALKNHASKIKIYSKKRDELFMKMKRVLCAAVIALAAAETFGAVYYVAPDGKNTNKGTKDSPFATLNKANSVVNAGDTVWIRGGTYLHTDTNYVKNDNMFAGIHLTKSGSSDNKRIHYLAYPGEKPVIDFSKMPIADGSNNIRYTSGILIQAQYLHLKGLEVKNVPMKGESNVGVYVS